MRRRFEFVSKYKDHNELPTRATLHSAGYDFSAINDYEIKPGEILLVSTGLKVYLKKNEVLLLVSRSSLPRKYSLLIPNAIGIIDKDYVDNKDNEGEIYVQLYNFSNNTVYLKKGERIAQGIFVNFKKTKPDQLNNVVRSGGFGSSDKK